MTPHVVFFFHEQKAKKKCKFKFENKIFIVQHALFDKNCLDHRDEITCRFQFVQHCCAECGPPNPAQQENEE
jgi:hypothetical protein